MLNFKLGDTVVQKLYHYSSTTNPICIITNIEKLNEEYGMYKICHKHLGENCETFLCEHEETLNRSFKLYENKRNIKELYEELKKPYKYLELNV